LRDCARGNAILIIKVFTGSLRGSPEIGCFIWLATAMKWLKQQIADLKPLIIE
jgi:hypothetical protein